MGISALLVILGVGIGLSFLPGGSDTDDGTELAGEDNTFDGTTGNDIVDGMGGDGQDSILGGSGDDLLMGGDGADLIESGAGSDGLVGFTRELEATDYNHYRDGTLPDDEGELYFSNVSVIPPEIRGVQK